MFLERATYVLGASERLIVLGASEFVMWKHG
jgi:hypothetical protein